MSALVPVSATWPRVTAEEYVSMSDAKRKTWLRVVRAWIESECFDALSLDDRERVLDEISLIISERILARIN